MRYGLFALACAQFLVSLRVEAQEYGARTPEEFREQNLLVYSEPEVLDSEETREDSILILLDGRALKDGYKLGDSLWNLVEFIPLEPFDYDIKVKIYPSKDKRTATADFVLKTGGLLEIKNFDLQRFLADRRADIADTSRQYDYGRSLPEVLEVPELPHKGSARWADLFEHGDPMIFHVDGPRKAGNGDTQMWFSILVPERVAERIRLQYQKMVDEAPDGEPSKEMMDNFTTSIQYLSLCPL